MKLRCPYCHETFEPQASSRCPHCGKVMMMPSRLKAQDASGTDQLKEKTAERRRRRRERRQAEASGAPAWFAFTRSPRYLAVLVVVFVLLGILLATQAGRRHTAGAGGRMTVVEWLTGPVGRGQVLTPEQRANESLGTLRTALELFHKNCGRYPSNREGLTALIRRPRSATGWDGPYIKSLWPDPWKQSYRYALTNGLVRLSSDGPDGRTDTSDDLFAPPPDMDLVNRLTAPAPAMP